MSNTFATLKRTVRCWAWIGMMPIIAVCAASDTTSTIDATPGTVSDLSVTATTETSATLAFSQVDNGMGEAASYDVRYATGPLSWGSATATASGTCRTPVAGTGSSGTLTCMVLGLSPSTSYEFQVTAFRGTLNLNAVFGGLSNIVAASTTASTPIVSTVTVAPASTSIAVGATAALQATVKDGQGNVMTGQTVTWSTSNAAAATVNSSGVVTGIAGGSATITATSSGKSGTSSITVTAAPPPPPGGTLLFQEDFENGNMGSRGWYDNTNVLLNTTEHVPGSTASAQYRFLNGADGPTSGGAQRHKFTPTNSLYISYYVKYSTNWVGSGEDYHPHEIHVLSTLDGDYDGPSRNWMTLYLEHNYQNGGKPVISLQDNKAINSSYGPLPHNLVGVTEDRSTAGCNGMAEANMHSECFDAGSYWYNLKQLSGPVMFQPNPGPGYKNNWNFIEAYFQLNTIVNGIGQKDGVMQYWFNGTLVIDRHDILFRTGARPTLKFSQFLLAPYIGDGSPADQSMFIDNLRVGTARLP